MKVFEQKMLVYFLIFKEIVPVLNIINSAAKSQSLLSWVSYLKIMQRFGG